MNAMLRQVNEGLPRPRWMALSADAVFRILTSLIFTSLMLISLILISSLCNFH